MQGTNSGQGNQNGQKQSALSWSQPPQSTGGVAKPISQVSVPPVQSKISPPAPANKSTPPMAAKMPAKPPVHQGKGGGRMAGIFAAGIIVGLIIGWGWFSLRTDSSKVATTPSTNSAAAASTAATASGATAASTNSADTADMTDMDTGTSASASSGALTVGSQSSGSAVAISNVSVSAPTWVVIFDNNKGKPGNALGAAMFFPGQKSGSIELLRSTVSGQSYLAGEYVDNGDHTFSKQSDTQVSDITSSQMLVQFSVK